MFGITFSIFCAFSGLVAVSEASIKDDTFELDSSFDGYVDETNIIKNSTATSTVDCSRQCGRDANCVAFYFTSTTKECQQHSTRSSKLMIGLISKPTSRYYRIPVVAPTPFVCPVHNGGWVTSQLPDGSVSQFLIVNDVSVDQLEAIAYCESQGANLPIIISAEKMHYYLNNIIPCADVNGFKFWVDGVNTPSVHAYKTRDGRVVPRIPELWASGRPNSEVNQNCIQSKNEQFGYKFDDRECDNGGHQILCEKIIIS